MATTTTNLGLKKPATTDYYNIQDFNDNADTLDTFAGNTITTDKLINNLAATEAGFGLDSRQGPIIQGEINAIITDNTRTTTSKTITGAINELNSSKASLASPALTGTPTIATFNILRALSGGYKIQTGTTSVTVTTAGTSAGTTVTFPVAFSSSVIVFAIPYNQSTSNTTYINVSTSSWTTTGFSLAANSGVAQGINIVWLAIGI